MGVAARRCCSAVSLRQLTHDSAEHGEAHQMLERDAAEEARVRATHWEAKYCSDPSAASFSWTVLGAPKTSLRLVLGALPREGREGEAVFIDVGGGASALAAEVAAADRRVGRALSVDLSATALATARALQGGDKAEYVVGDVLSFRFPPCDVWHDRAVFHFLTTDEDQRTYAAQAARSVVEGGHVVLGTFGADGGPLRCSGLPVRRWTAAELGYFWVEHGFRLEDSCGELHTTPGGATQKFVFVVLRRLPDIGADSAECARGPVADPGAHTFPL